MNVSIEDPNVTSAVLSADDERHSAMIRSDVAALDRLLADTLVYTHGTPRREGKDEYLVSVSRGRIRYREILRSDAVVQVYGRTAVMRGHIRIRATSSGEPRELNNLFQSVWALSGDQWQMVAWASIPIPGAAG
ncbi:MAG TPA: nuclear transport factor 2 family protein [Burkholderiaceae bacterium]|nr:nuclear transport factor 2 family protein [Burkholderiaceae bacterium]